jgi:hypothetical protein
MNQLVAVHMGTARRDNANCQRLCHKILAAGHTRFCKKANAPRSRVLCILEIEHALGLRPTEIESRIVREVLASKLLCKRFCMAKPSTNLKTSVQGFTNSRRNLLSTEQWLAPDAADVCLKDTLEPHTAWSILAPCIVARS